MHVPQDGVALMLLHHRGMCERDSHATDLYGAVSAMHPAMNQRDPRSKLCSTQPDR